MSDIKKISIAESKEILEGLGLRIERKRYAKTTVREYLQMIEPAELASKYLALYDSLPDHKIVPAGAKHHHSWEGGLEEHLQEMVGFGLDLMETYPGDFTAFTRSDFIIVVFCHDLHKVWDYRKITDEERAKNPKKFVQGQVFTYKEGTPLVDKESRTLLTLARSGIVPTDVQWSGVLFAEGSYSSANYTANGRSQIGNYVNSKNPIVVLVSMCDTYSAQILGRSIYQW